MTVPPGPDLSVLTDDELAEERDFLLQSLRDLEDERGAGDVDDHDYQQLKDGYTARAAAVLRVLDERRSGMPEAEMPLEPGPGRPSRRALGAAALVVAFAVGAGLLVARSAGQRLPGQTVSGSTPTDKVTSLLAQAGSQVQSNNILGALQSLQQVLAIDPRNVQALANQGWLVAITGNTARDQTLIDKGLAEIRSAEQLDPGYADAHFFAGTILLNGGQAKDAVTEFEEYLADDSTSTQAALVRQDLQTAQALAAGKVPAGATEVTPTTAR